MTIFHPPSQNNVLVPGTANLLKDTLSKHCISKKKKLDGDFWIIPLNTITNNMKVEILLPILKLHFCKKDPK